jgi:hypothetical protein
MRRLSYEEIGSFLKAILIIRRRVYCAGREYLIHRKPALQRFRYADTTSFVVAAACAICNVFRELYERFTCK